jgi:hypothetical protein
MHCDKLDSQIIEEPAYAAVHALRDAFKCLSGRWRHPGHDLLRLRCVFHVTYLCYHCHLRPHYRQRIVATRLIAVAVRNYYKRTAYNFPFRINGKFVKEYLTT